jgi:hypothetical protein
LTAGWGNLPDVTWLGTERFEAVALYFVHYNFVRTHKALANPYATTPAMAAGLTDHIWTVEEIVKLADKLIMTT